jgi:hypothetical protein
VRHDKALLSSGCKSHPPIAPAGSSWIGQGGNELAEAFGTQAGPRRFEDFTWRPHEKAWSRERRIIRIMA